MSREADILNSMISGGKYEKTPQSRNEEILISIIDNTPYEAAPQSEIERLLLELKDKGGGSGGGGFKELDIKERNEIKSIITVSETEV